MGGHRQQSGLRSGCTKKQRPHVLVGLTPRSLWLHTHQHIHISKTLRLALSVAASGGSRVRRFSSRRTVAVRQGSTGQTLAGQQEEEEEVPQEDHRANGSALELFPSLLRACLQNDRRAVRHMLLKAAGEHGAQQLPTLINHQDPATGLGLVAAATSNPGSENLLRSLLAHGASTYVYDHAGVSPLMRAAAAGDPAVIKLLLDQGEADAFHMSSAGRTALMEAVAHGHQAAVVALLRHGQADPRQASEGTSLLPAGDAPLASDQLLLTQLEPGHRHAHAPALLGQPWGAQGGLLRGASSQHALQQQGLGSPAESDASWASQLPNGNHALLDAVAGGHLPILRVLAGHGAKLNQTDKDGNTALLLAARQGDLGVVEFLLRRGAKVCIASFSQRRTALMEAACNGHLPVVLALLNHCSLHDLKATDLDGRRAEDLAGRPAIREVLASAERRLHERESSLGPA